MTCAFCDIIAGHAPATIIREWRDTIAIVPLDPVTPGHIIVMPKHHATDATAAPYLAAITMRATAELARPPCNIITSAGAAATQTIPHLHIHIVPRTEDDGLALPWAPPRPGPQPQPKTESNHPTDM